MFGWYALLHLHTHTSLFGTDKTLVSQVGAIGSASVYLSYLFMAFTRIAFKEEGEEFYMLQPASKSDRMCHPVPMIMRSLHTQAVMHVASMW